MIKFTNCNGSGRKTFTDKSVKTRTSQCHNCQKTRRVPVENLGKVIEKLG